MDRASVPSNVRDEVMHHLMGTYGTSIKRMCWMILHDVETAADAMQDTFVKAYRNIERLMEIPPDEEKQWLMRIAINTCNDYKRSAWFRHVDRRVDPEDLGISVELTSDTDLSLFQAVQSLPTKMKEIVLLFYYQDMSVHEIAGTLGISGPTVYSRLKKAQNKLRVELLEREVMM